MTIVDDLTAPNHRVDGVDNYSIYLPVTSQTRNRSWNLPILIADNHSSDESLLLLAYGNLLIGGDGGHGRCRCVHVAESPACFAPDQIQHRTMLP